MRLHLPLGLLSAVLACYASSSLALGETETITTSSGAEVSTSDICSPVTSKVTEEIKNVSVSTIVGDTNDNNTTVVTKSYSKSDELTVSGAVCGSSSYEKGDIYVEIDGTVGDDEGVFNGVVSGVSNTSTTADESSSNPTTGAIEILLNGGTYNAAVIAGDSDASSEGTIAGGTNLTIEDGTFKDKVLAGGANGTINNGTQLTITDGKFYGPVYVGSESGVINGVAEVKNEEGAVTTDAEPAISAEINGGTFYDSVVLAGDGTVNGDVVFHIADGTFGASYDDGTTPGWVISGGNATVNGDVLGVIDGGTFLGNVTFGGIPGGALDVDGDVTIFIADGTFGGTVENVRHRVSIEGARGSVSGDVSIYITGGNFTDCWMISAASSGTLSSTSNTYIEIDGDVLNKERGTVIYGGTYASDEHEGLRTIAFYDAADGTKVGELFHVIFKDFDVIDVEGTVSLGSRINDGTEEVKIGANGDLTIIDASNDVSIATLTGEEGASLTVGNGTDATNLTISDAEEYAGDIKTLAKSNLSVGGEWTLSENSSIAEDSTLTLLDESTVTVDADSIGGTVALEEGGSATIKNSEDLDVAKLSADEDSTLNKGGAGTLTLKDTEAVTIGTLNIKEGGVETSGELTASAIDLAESTELKLGGDATVTDLTGSGKVSADSKKTLTVGGDEDSAFAGVFSDNVAVTKEGEGTLTLTGSSTTTEALTVSAGTVELGDGETDSSWAGDVSVAKDATLAINSTEDVTLGSGTDDVVQSLTLAEGATLLQEGEGKLTIDSLDNIAGTVKAGEGSELVLTSVTDFKGTIAAESGATLTIGGDWNVGTDTDIAEDATVILDKANLIVGSTEEDAEAVDSEIGGALTISDNTTFTVNGDSSLTLASGINYLEEEEEDPGEQNPPAGNQAEDETPIVVTKAGTGTLVLGGDNELDSVALTDGGLVIDGISTIDTLTTSDDNATTLEVSENGALLLTADETELKNVTLTGDGIFGVADGTKVTVADNSAIDGDIQLITAEGGTLELKNAENTLKSINGDGTINLSGDKGTKLTVTGDSIFEGTLEGKGTLSVEGGLSLLDTEGNSDIALEVHAAEVDLGDTAATYKSVTVDNGGSLVIGLPGSGSSAKGNALRAASASTGAQLAVGSEGLSVASGSTLTLTVDAPTIAALQAIDPIVTSEGDITLASGSTLEIDNQSTIASADVDTFKVTLMTADGTATADGVNLIFEKDNKLFQVLYDTALTVEGGKDVVLVGKQVKTNTFTASGLPVNATAGANLLWDARFNAVAAPSLLGKVFEAAVDQKLAGDTAKLSKTLAAVAGSTINSVGTAQRDALQDQLETIRDRALTNSTDGSQLGHHFWIEGNGGYNHVRTQTDKGGYKLSTWGATVGADMEVNKDLTLGLALTANYGDLRATAADRTTGDLDNYFLNLFGHYQSGAWGHTLVLTGVSTDADLDRSVDYGAGSYKAHGSTDGYGIGALYEVSYDFKLNDKGTSILQPLFDASIVHTSLDSYTETGASNAGLNVGKQEWTTGTLAVGARWSGTFGTQKIGKTLFGELRATVGQDLGDKQGKTGVSLIGSPRFSQNVYGAKQGATSFQLSGGISTNIGQNGTIYANAGAEVRNDANSVYANIGYRYAF